MTYPIGTLSVAQLKKAAALKEKIEKLEKQLAQLLGASDAPAAKAPRKKRKMTAAGRARISAAAKARWARERVGN